MKTLREVRVSFWQNSLEYNNWTSGRLETPVLLTCYYYCVKFKEVAQAFLKFMHMMITATFPNWLWKEILGLEGKMSFSSLMLYAIWPQKDHQDFEINSQLSQQWSETCKTIGCWDSWHPDLRISTLLLSSQIIMPYPNSKQVHIKFSGIPVKKTWHIV